jgi:hypothetical protein
MILILLMQPIRAASLAGNPQYKSAASTMQLYPSEASAGLATLLSLKPVINTLCRIESPKKCGAVKSCFPVNKTRSRHRESPAINAASAIAA